MRGLFGTGTGVLECFDTVTAIGGVEDDMTDEYIRSIVNNARATSSNNSDSE